MLDPPGWGKDSLSRFFEDAHHNNKAASVNLRSAWDHLGRIGDLLSQACSCLTNTQTILAPHFLIDAHSCYLAGVRLATSGQIRPAYMVLRGCLESSMYGLHIAKNEEAKGAIWLNRHVDDATLKAMKNEFSISNVQKTLACVDPETAKAVALLYQLVIDYGGHPNPYALLTMVDSKEEGKTTTELQDVLSQDCPAMRLCLKTTADVGLCALHVFHNVYRERFDILSITHKLIELRSPKWFQAYRVPSTASGQDSSLRSE